MPKNREKGHVTTVDAKKNRKKGHVTTVDAKKTGKKTHNNSSCQKTGKKDT